MGKALRYIIGTLAAVGAIGALGALGFVFSGDYDIAANQPHLAPVQRVLVTTQERSIREHAKGIAAPALRDPERVRRGFSLYRDNCLPCHGAPGVARGGMGRGTTPHAPPLVTEAATWSDAEVYWIIRNGIKMTGMPAFSTGLTEADLWALVAFVRRLPELSMQEYGAMVAWDRGVVPASAVEWVEDDDSGFRRMVSEGDAERGRALLDRYGCGACHRIPGVRGARGLAGPPLDRWAERHFVAGALVNTPANLVHWIVDPQAVEPGTAMPGLDVTEEEALDMTRYLFTLGRQPLALHAVLRKR